jgi:hypothetical protein
MPLTLRQELVSILAHIDQEIAAVRDLGNHPLLPPDELVSLRDSIESLGRLQLDVEAELASNISL